MFYLHLHLDLSFGKLESIYSRRTKKHCQLTSLANSQAKIEKRIVDMNTNYNNHDKSSFVNGVVTITFKRNVDLSWHAP